MLAGAVIRVGQRVASAPAGAVGVATRLGRYLRAAVALVRLPRAARRRLVRVTADQVWFTGVEATPWLISIGLLFAVGLMAMGYRTFAGLGAASSFGQLLRLGLVGELGPLLSGLIVAARSGTAITADLGGMTLRNEVDALRAHGIDPVVWIVWPRLVGVTLANVLTTLVFMTSVYAGCVAVAPALGVAPLSLGSMLVEPLLPVDVHRMLVKAALFGICTATVSVRRGLELERDARDLPRAGSRAVVAAIIGIFVLDALVTLGMLR